MNRFSYYRSPFANFADRTVYRELGARLRLPAALVGAALLTVGIGWSAAAQRVHALDSELAGLNARLAAAAAGEHRAEQLTAAIVRLRAIDGGVAVARRDALIDTNIIARIGNALPPRTWLTGVDAAGGAWTIDGRSTRIGEIGTMLRRIQLIEHTATAHLVSVTASGRSRSTLDFVIAWTPDP